VLKLIILAFLISVWEILISISWTETPSRHFSFLYDIYFLDRDTILAILIFVWEILISILSRPKTLLDNSLLWTRNSYMASLCLFRTVLCAAHATKPSKAIVVYVWEILIQLRSTFLQRSEAARGCVVAVAPAIGEWPCEWVAARFG